MHQIKMLEGSLQNGADLTQLHEEYISPETVPWDAAHCDTFIEKHSAENMEYARSSAPIPLKPKRRIKNRRKRTEDPETPQFSPYAGMDLGFGESSENHVDCARSEAPSIVSVGIYQPPTKERKRREQTSDPQTPQFSPYVKDHPSLNNFAKEPVEYARSVAPSVISVAISRPPTKERKQREQTIDPQTPQFSPYVKDHPSLNDSTKEPVEYARSVAPSVMSVAISRPQTKERKRREQTTDSQTPEFSPYVKNHSSLNDSAKEPVEYARSVAPSLISVAISRPQVPPSPWYPPIPDPTKNRQQVSVGKKQSLQRSQSYQPKQQEMYSQPPQQYYHSNPQQQQLQYAQQQPPYSQPRQPPYRAPVQHHTQYTQPLQQQPTYSPLQHPSSINHAYESKKFHRVMYRPEVSYSPVFPEAPPCSDPDVVSRYSLQAAKCLLQNGYI